MKLLKLGSIRSKILLIVLILTIVLGGMLVGMTAVNFVNTGKLLRNDAKAQLSTETERINAEIEVLETTAVSLAHTGSEFYSYSDKSVVVGKRITLDFFNSFENVVGGGIWFEPYAIDNAQKRTAFYAMNTPEGYIIDDGFLSEEYDYHNQSWYLTIKSKASLSSDKTLAIWTSPYVDEAGTHQLMTTLGSGIYDTSGNLVGISTVDWLLTDIVARLNNDDLRPTDNSFVALADIENDFIISCTLDGAYSGKYVSSFPILSQFDKVDRDGETHESVKNLTLNDKRTKYVTYGAYLANGMTLVACVPKSELYSEVIIEIVAISISLAIIIVVAIIAVLFIVKNSLTNPIMKLADGAAALGRGEFDKKIVIAGNDELSLVAKSFNTMTADLNDYMNKLTEETAKSMSISAELNIANDIQNSLLPAIFPAFPNRYEIELYAKMQAAKEVGGDFYDFFLIDDDHLAFTITDVSGKGIPAALFMVITKTLLKTQGLSGISPSKVLYLVNNQLCENNNANMFATTFFAVLEISTGELIFSNAGHNPIAIRRNNEKFEYLDAPVGFVLAGMEDIPYSDTKIVLNKNDTLVLYTDGVTEALNPKLDLYGEDRLLDVLNVHCEDSTEGIVKAVYDDIQLFADGAKQADDITMLVLTYKGAKNPSTFETDATIENLPLALDFIDKRLEEKNVSEMQRMQMAIVAEEIYANVAHYAYPDTTGKVRINVHVDSEIILEFIDKGIEYNPLSREAPNLISSAEERGIGGLGILMVKSMTDNLYYRYANKQNILSLVKKVGDLEVID